MKMKLSAALIMMCLITAVIWSIPEVYGATVPHCESYRLPGCPRNLSPVCGTDGNTYANECILCFANRDSGRLVLIKRNGEC
ncbi:serine protease inhibitor Kazal-type 2 [Bombina bombina]|uniref:serine protease inhibitor Kazal-type 2 n=1 Tax=Bombina bombina TaxID=8345 RepID=UPI00235AABF6|nr:serine protease inhibitor Kazal-type 2 [Bombina bombina]